MNNPDTVTVSGLEINLVNAIVMFLHHLQSAVSFLETTPLTEEEVCKVINETKWATISETMVKFCDTVAHLCFQDFEWEEEQHDKEDKDNLADSLFIPGVKVFTLDPNDPDAAKKLHEMLGQILGQ